MTLSLLQRLYAWGLALDRALTRAHRLPVPVVSVGNIAVGGRGKTPFVIWLARGLQARGYAPVVLTRGYGRRSRLPVVLLDPATASAEETGDEALEIGWLARVPVLVGAERLLNAQHWLATQASKSSAPSLSQRTVFLLDDGFQHWKLARDFDLVLTDPSDARDGLLPSGRLREWPEALRRASLVLERGRDFQKISRLRRLPPTGEALVLTTRAPDKTYLPSLQALVGSVALRLVELSDHAEGAAAERRLAREPAGLPLLLGAKEAVKLLAPGAQAEFFREAFVPAGRSGLGRDVYGVELELELRGEDRIWAALLPALAARGTGIA